MKLHTFCNDNLRHRLMALQSNTALCDFTFKLHDSTQFSTHKAVVAAFSTTALMLCDETGQVVIPRHDITRDIFQIVLNFIYGQSIVVKDTYMKQLEWLANYLGIEDLSKVLVPFKSLTSNSDVCIEIKEEPIELNDELDVQESTSAMLHNAVFSDTYADDNDIKDEDNEHSAIFTKQRQKRHKTSKGKAKTKSSKKRKTDDTSKIKSDNASKELADDKNDDTDIDNEDDINDEMDTGESASNETNDNLENVTTKQEPADSEQVAEPSTSANADQVEDDTKQQVLCPTTIPCEMHEMQESPSDTDSSSNDEMRNIDEAPGPAEQDGQMHVANESIDDIHPANYSTINVDDEPVEAFDESCISLNISVMSINEPLDDDTTTPTKSNIGCITSTPLKNSEKKRVCNLCGYTTKWHYHLKRHMKTHNDEFAVKCHICQKSFADKYAVGKHIRSKHQHETYICEHCGKSFKSQNSIPRHVKEIHGEGLNYRCEKCGKDCLRYSHYQDHIDWHNGVKKYKCKYCQKSYFWTGSLSNHESVCKAKQENKPITKKYSCLLCKKSFSLQRYLKTHVKLHDTNQPKTKCSMCTKSFSSKSNLKRHVKIIHKAVF